MATSDYLDLVQKLYIAYFGRPADPTGLNYWASQVNAPGGNMTVAITGFSASSESTNLFGGLPSAQKISAIYLNLFNRLPESTGLSYWINQLDSGAVTQAQAAWEIMNQAGAGDAASVANKLAMANIFTAQVDTAAEIAGYNGAQPAAYGRAYLAGIDATPGSVSIANSALNNSVADATGVRPAPPVVTTPPAPATVFTSGTDSFTTTDSTLVYTATLGGISPTLTANDSLHGAGNTLNITDTSGNQTSWPSGLDLTGVATVNLTTAGNVGISGVALDPRFAGLSHFTLHSSGTNTDYLRGGSVALTIDSQASSIQITSGWGSLDITDNHLTGATALSLAGTGGAVTLHDPTGATTLTIALNAVTLTGGFTDADNHITNLTLAGTTNLSKIDAITDSALTSLTLTGNVALGTNSSQLLTLGNAVTSLSGATDNAANYIRISAANTVVTLGNGDNTIVDASTSGTTNITLGNGNNSFVDSGIGASRVMFGTGFNTADLGGYSNGVIAIGVNAGYSSSPTTPNLVVNHAAAGDNIAVLSISGHFQTQYLVGALGTHGTTAGTISNLESLLSANSTAQSFALDRFGGDTFIVATASGTLGATDTTVIQLVGYTGNVTWSGSDNVLHLT
ncbi:hypothetical protein M2401_003683 [Pseudomonas sp. JUb42]|uniref:beta strand repeat-containing protein n=1 Tax=Pseudomonas sp. JUb42 TaxID=2940611 RepID=UPI0021675FD9|nr:DUF4214 domain-containing protein [Pseudomonas sp. JUb42]MCS3469943.1 hypothetical protein [Pseudomonas sp. JUb42]